MTCSVYILGGVRSPIKVGIAVNVRRRAGDVGTYAPWPVKLLDEWEFPYRSVAYAVEQTSHAMLWDHHLNGEWFKATFSDGAGAVEDAIGLVEDHLTDFRGDLIAERPLWNYIRDTVLYDE